MQTDYKHIYKELADSTGKTEQLYKDLGNFVWAECYSMIRNPQSLIVKLKGVGNWHLRKKRMDIVVHEWTDRSVVKLREEFDNENAWNEYVDKKFRYDIFVERLKDYEVYLTRKREVKIARSKTQYLLTPTKDPTKFNTHED